MNENGTNTAVATALPSYLTLKTVANVMVKVPIDKYMRWMNEFTPDGQPPVPAHYQHGVLIQDTKIIVNDHFFIDEDTLGMQICARVDVKQKTMPDGRIFILRDIHPCEPNLDNPFFVMKFKKGVERGTPIPETTHFLQFNRTAPPSE